MKWKTAKRPKCNDERIGKYFAFLPVDIDDGNTVWLGWYYVPEKLIDTIPPRWIKIGPSTSTYNKQTTKKE